MLLASTPVNGRETQTEGRSPPHVRPHRASVPAPGRANAGEACRTRRSGPYLCGGGGAGGGGRGLVGRRAGGGGGGGRPRRGGPCRGGGSGAGGAERRLAEPRPVGGRAGDFTRSPAGAIHG